MNDEPSEAKAVWDPRRLIAVEMPYKNQTASHLKIDPAAKGVYWHEAMTRLLRDYNEYELERILRGTALLAYMECGTIGECLATAMIWERG